jgi:hypothetical protein
LAMGRHCSININVSFAATRFVDFLKLHSTNLALRRNQPHAIAEMIA